MGNLKIGQVFVPGGEPKYTYNPRKSSNLENKLKEYLESPFKILSITGSTKSGKTVLARKVLPTDDSIWVSGGHIKIPDDLWNRIIQELNLFNQVSEVQDSVSSKSQTQRIQGGISAPYLNLSGSSGQTQRKDNQSSSAFSRNINPSFIGTKALSEMKVPLVIDDFHYIEGSVQLDIVRSLKDCVFEGVPIVIIAVPHRAYDAVRVEKEMTGRVEQLEIPRWESSELKEIAFSGFNALNVKADHEIVEQLVQESVQSPHIVQDFCLSLCRDNGIKEDSIHETILKPPSSWDKFFHDKSQVMGRQEFERLARGPRQRSDRKERYFKNGETGDIYKAVLYAISKIGAQEKLEYEEIRAGLRDVLLSEPPSSQEVGRVLDKMSEIAKDQIQGEPVLDWDKDYTTLYLSDPFFIYYLKWGAYHES
jgi:hypothetical protein